MITFLASSMINNNKYMLSFLAIMINTTTTTNNKYTLSFMASARKDNVSGRKDNVAVG